MADIAILEERVSTLEKQIHGTKRMPLMDTSSSGSHIIADIINTNTFLSSALSGRRNANSLLKRIPDLENYLNSSSEELELQTNALFEYILESEMGETLEKLIKLQSLLPVLETNEIRDVPILYDKFNELSLNYLKMNETSKALSEKINNLFFKYNATLTSISKLLISLDATVTLAEKVNIQNKQIS